MITYIENPLKSTINKNNLDNNESVIMNDFIHDYNYEDYSTSTFSSTNFDKNNNSLNKYLLENIYDKTNIQSDKTNIHSDKTNNNFCYNIYSNICYYLTCCCIYSK